MPKVVLYFVAACIVAPILGELAWCTFRSKARKSA
jgi:hypothetical protein